jgi:hypothetical protein
MTKAPKSDDFIKALFNSVEAVDELGNIKAQIAVLEKREKSLTEALKATGNDSFEGTLWDCTVSRSERETVDTKSLRADLGEDIIKDYVRTSQVVILRMTAKK